MVVGSSYSMADFHLDLMAFFAVLLGLVPGPLLYFFLKTYVWLASLQSNEERKADELIEIAERNVNKASSITKAGGWRV